MRVYMSYVWMIMNARHRIEINDSLIIHIIVINLKLDSRYCSFFSFLLSQFLCRVHLFCQIHFQMIDFKICIEKCSIFISNDEIWFNRRNS